MPNVTRQCRYCKGTGRELDPIEIGAVMRDWRKKAKKTLREVAKAMGYSPPYISDLELGRRAWTDELVGKYNDALTQ